MSPESHFLKHKNSFLLRKYKTFFRSYRFLKYKKFSRGGYLLFFELGVRSSGFHFRKCKRSFLLRKYKIFLNIRARKFHFRKYMEFFSGDFFWRGWGRGEGLGLGSAGFHFWKYKEFLGGVNLFLFLGGLGLRKWRRWLQTTLLLVQWLL